MKSLAVVVALSRASDLPVVRRSLAGQAGVISELLLVEDGVGGMEGVDLNALRDLFPFLRTITYKTPSFFLGSWKPVVDSLSSEYVMFLDADVLLAPGCLGRFLEVAQTNPDVGMVFGSMMSGADAGFLPGVNQPHPRRFTPVDFAREINGIAAISARSERAALFKVSTWKVTGGFRAELDACHAHLPFLVAGLSAPSCHAGITGNLCIRQEPLTSRYLVTSPYRCLDDLARVHHAARKQVGTFAESIDRWYASVQKEYVNRMVGAFNDRMIAANKLVDECRNRLPLAIRPAAWLLQPLIGLSRRILSCGLRRSMNRYHPDVECYGWIKPSFSFGVNWSNFITQKFNPERLDIARRDLLEFLGVGSLEGRTLIDIGCGSGIHSLAMIRSGAKKLFSFDYDNESVNATRRLYEREGSPAHWTVTQGSILEEAFVRSVPKADIVYSWGVLHHTGQMWAAIKSASTMVAEGGIFFIAIYNKWTGSDEALRLKIRYNRAGWFGKRWMELCLMRQGIPRLSYLFKDFRHFRDRVKDKYVLIRDYRKMRGMSFYHDIVDWLGGYPYEDATVEEVIWFCEKECGLELVKVRATGGNYCSDYLFRRPASGR